MNWPAADFRAACTRGRQKWSHGEAVGGWADGALLNKCAQPSPLDQPQWIPLTSACAQVALDSEQPSWIHLQHCSMAFDHAPIQRAAHPLQRGGVAEAGIQPAKGVEEVWAMKRQAYDCKARCLPPVNPA